MPRRAQRSIDALVRRTLRQVGAKEIKAAPLLKRGHGAATIDRVLDEAFQAGAVPLYVVSEKRHNIAQKIVDVLIEESGVLSVLLKHLVSATA